MGETYPVGAMARSPERAAYAANWRQVLAADAAIGLVGVVVGLVVLFVLDTVALGAGVAAFGAVYVVAVGRRAWRWRRLRAEAGL
jgi:hypothetical protein